MNDKLRSRIAILGKSGKTYVLGRVLTVAIVTFLAVLIAGGSYIISYEAGKRAAKTGEHAAVKISSVQIRKQCDAGNLVRALDQIKSDGGPYEELTHAVEGIRDCAIFQAYGAVVRIPARQEAKYLRLVKRKRVPVVVRGMVVKSRPIPTTTTLEYLRRCKCRPPA